MVGVVWRLRRCVTRSLTGEKAFLTPVRRLRPTLVEQLIDDGFVWLMPERQAGGMSTKY